MKEILLNQNDLSNDIMFSNLQGNILKGHGRNFTSNIFVKFDKNREKKFKEWMKSFSDEKITSCKKQLKENELYKRNKISGGVFYSFFLTASGYNFLNQDYTLFDHSKFDVSFKKFESSFKNGMENSKLNDPLKSKWDKGFSEEIHAMILVSDNNQESLGNATREIVEELDKFSRIVTIEHGNAIRNENGDGLEHFGYVDGISQPLFFEDELENYKKQNGAVDKFNPSANKNLVLINDPFVDEKDAYGSYFVFRKLEQNVRKFKKDEKKLSWKSQLNLPEDDEERAGAMLVGRFEDGTPSTLFDKNGMIGSGAFNNFNYDNDNLGAKCPFHAHIRKTNPRTEEHKKHIMARRGIPYGQRNTPMNIEQDYSQMPENGVGLLFMSYQASISKQFEEIQKLANNPIVGQAENNLDPIIGQISTEHNKNISEGMFPVRYNDSSSLKKASFKSAVSLKGGEYFFAPSIPFLKNL